MLARRLLIVARGGGAFAAPAVPFAMTSAPEGGWPGATQAFLHGTTSEIGYCDNAGNIAVLAWDGSATTTDIGGPTTPDHHNAPALLRRSSDGRFVAVMCSHNSADIYRRVSTNPDDSTAWAAAANIDASLGGSAYTYPALFELGDETDDPVYLFVRSANSGGGPTMTWSLATSTDGGATWGAETDLITGTRYYGRCAKASESRLDFAFTDGSYAEDYASMYHCYYEGGDWFASDGTDIGDPPFDVGDLTLVYDGSSAGARFPNSLVSLGGEVVIAFPVQTGTPTDHVGEDSDYIYARWDGADWTTHVLAADVGAPSFDFPEGGLAVDPANLDRVAASIQVGGAWRMHVCTTANDGATWASAQVTDSGDDDVYPWWVDGHGTALEFVWLKGTLTTENDFSFAIYGYGRP